MYILYQMVQIKRGATVSSLEVQAQNEKFKRYEGTQRGGIVKKLLQEAILNNQEEDRWKDDSITSRCVCVRTNVKEILDNFSGESAMIAGLDGSRDYGVKYPSNIQRIANCVEKNRKYKVYFTYNDAGFIWEIHIEDI